MTEFSKSSPEQKNVVEDNDRKFTLGTIDPRFLTEHATRSYTLITDWLETNAADETKVVQKIFDDKVQTLLIAKTTVNGNRTAAKKDINEDEYLEHLKLTVVHVEKIRYELEIEQDGATFNAKYDEFIDSDLRMLEVGPDISGNDKQFIPQDFGYSLHEVSDDLSFTGFRITGHIS